MQKIVFCMALWISTVSVSMKNEIIKDGSAHQIAQPIYKVNLRLSDDRVISITLNESFDCIFAEPKKTSSKSQLRPAMVKRIQKSQRVSRPTQKYAAFLATLEKNKEKAVS